MYAMRLLVVLFVALTFLMFRCHEDPNEEGPHDEPNDQQPNEQDNWIDVNADNFLQYFEVVVTWPLYGPDATPSLNGFDYTVHFETLTGVIVESAVQANMEIFWNFSIQHTQTQAIRSYQYQWNLGSWWIEYHQTQSYVVYQLVAGEVEEHEVVLSVNYTLDVLGAMGKVSLEPYYQPPSGS